VTICRELARGGALVAAYDPALRALPAEVAVFVDLCSSAAAAIAGASAVLVGNESAEFRDLDAGELTRLMTDPLVVDPGGFLEKVLGNHAGIRYYKVGRQT